MMNTFIIFPLIAAAFLLFTQSSFSQPYAYVTNLNSHDVSVIDTATNTVTDTITVGNSPRGIVITPRGTRAYVANSGSNSVSVIDTDTNMVTDTIAVGISPRGIAITPDGSRVYVANFFISNVTVIDTAANMPIGSPIAVGIFPSGIAITPDSTRAYVTNTNSSDVTVINTATNMTMGSPIPVGIGPLGIAITPDGSRAYVVNIGSGDVSVINTTTNMVSGSPIEVGTFPSGIAITPDGSRAYVTNGGSNNVSVINTAANMVTGTIPAGIFPRGIAITPDGKSAYVANSTSSNVSVINTETNMPVGSPIEVGTTPFDIAITPLSPDISLSPESATNEVRTEHTVTALIDFNGNPGSGILVDFEIIAGPNRGVSGECSPNVDCATDANGEVSWTYKSGRALGTDTTIASYFDEELQKTIDSSPAFKTWVLPERAVPTMSKWGLIATAVILGFISLLVIGRRKATS